MKLGTLLVIAGVLYLFVMGVLAYLLGRLLNGNWEDGE